MRTQENDITNAYECQVRKILQKVVIKKDLNTTAVDWLTSRGFHERAWNISDCATNVGFLNDDGKAKIVSANFCRQRLCHVCAWRRSLKFTTQMKPILRLLEDEGYEFIFATLTVKNVSKEHLKQTVDDMLRGYDRLLKLRVIKRAWLGKVRGLEITYNRHTGMFHPHMHILVAVTPDYFSSKDYITYESLSKLWKESMRLNYTPIVDIRRTEKGSGRVVEVLKYATKSFKDSEAIEGFYNSLRDRRLISFSGVFAEKRKLMKMTDFDTVLVDDIEGSKMNATYWDIYRFDPTGGVFKFYTKYKKE